MFCSNSVIAQRSAAVAGTGLVVLPAFVGDESPALFRILPEDIRILRPVWMSVGLDQHLLKTIKQTAKAIARVFAEDRQFLLGETPSPEARPCLDDKLSGSRDPEPAARGHGHTHAGIFDKSKRTGMF